MAIDATAQTRVLAAELKALRPIPYLVELNYWAGVGTNASGGQTQIFAGTTGTWSSRTAAQVLRTFFISANHWLAQGGS